MELNKKTNKQKGHVGFTEEKKTPLCVWFEHEEQGKWDGGMLCWYKQQHCLRHKQGGTTFQTKHYRQQISGTKWGGGKEEEWRRSDWVSSPLSLLPALTWPVSLLTKQPAWS